MEYVEALGGFDVFEVDGVVVRGDGFDDVGGFFG